MARACGIRLGHRAFEIVALDGSAKNPKVKFSHRGLIPAGEDPIEAGARAVRAVFKEQKLPTDNVSLAIDGGLAAYRSVTLPFDDRGKTEQVIKFEVESELPQWDIDEVVVDFHVVNSTGVESQVLVTAVPKSEIAERLAAFVSAGVEPFEVELETSALVNAAQSAGLLTIDAAQVLVHVGEYSSSVVVVDGGHVRSMRAIQIGWAERDEAPAETEPSDDEEAATEIDLPAPQPEPRIEDPHRLEAVRARLQRELGRTVAGAQTAHPVSAVYLCGGEVPGLVGQSVLDVPVEALELVPDADGGGSTPVVAFGAALGRLGGGLLTPSLRREELRYAGKFERIEFPLAVMMLLLLCFLLVQWIVVERKIGWRDEKGDMQVWLHASNNYMKHYLPALPDSIRQYADKAQAGEDEERTKYQEMRRIQGMLESEISRILKVLGSDADVAKPQSALEATTLVLSVLSELGDQVGRFSIRELTADYQMARRGSTPEQVMVKMDLTFFGDDLEATRGYLAFRNTLSEKPWVLDVPEQGSDPLKEGEGISVDNFTVYVDTNEVVRP